MEIFAPVIIFLVYLLLMALIVRAAYKVERGRERVWVVSGYHDNNNFDIVAICRSHEKAVEIKTEVEQQYYEVWVGYRRLDRR